ncbi:MAG: ribose-phosphate pyrophosphokinase [Bacilli bacterium]|nr:ribose-phosphate pyrophosphokinase [Bacilli bacterium]
MENKILFYLTSSKAFATKVSEETGIPLGEVEIRYFSDGELMVRCLSEVKGKNVFVIQSTGKPSAQTLFELELFVDAVKSAGANKVYACLPYYGYCRQDRISYDGEPISARVVAKVLEAVGVDGVFTIDLHTEEVEKYFDIDIFNLKPFEIYANYFTNKVDAEELVVITPDHGSDDRAIAFGKYFPGCSVGFFTKHRPSPNRSEVLSFTGDVEGKTCIVVDDIIDTCGTINNAIEVLTNKKAKEIFVIGTHAVFSSNARVRGAREVVVSDTIENKVEGVRIISVTKLLSDAIKKC